MSDIPLMSRIIAKDGCVSPGTATCTRQNVVVPGETEVQVSVATSAANASNAIFLNVVQWDDTAVKSQVIIAP